MFALVALAPFLLGMLAFGILSANYYHSQAHAEGFWHNLKWYFSTLGGLLPRVAALFNQVISNWMGQAVQTVDAHVGASFHYIANEVRAASDTMLEFSAFALTLAQFVTGQVSWPQVSAALKQLRGEIRVAEHKALAAEQAALRQEKAAVRSVAQGVYPRLRGLEHTVEDVIPREIRHLRSDVKAAEDHAINTFKWIKTHPLSLATTAFAGAVAVALGRLGMGWLRCNSARDFGKNVGCNFWKLLGDVLGILATLALSIFSVLRPQDLAEAAVAAVDTIEPILSEILSN